MARAQDPYRGERPLMVANLKLIYPWCSVPDGGSLFLFIFDVPMVNQFDVCRIPGLPSGGNVPPWCKDGALRPNLPTVYPLNLERWRGTTNPRQEQSTLPSGGNVPPVRMLRSRHPSNSLFVFSPTLTNKYIFTYIFVGEVLWLERQWKEKCMKQQ